MGALGRAVSSERLERRERKRNNGRKVNSAFCCNRLRQEEVRHERRCLMRT